ncbi:hypothetical protein L2E82_30672 [Cichorium intybus]|uniref:Uncharacterized protein n=1 Tax=Cichorium intybus TaxID=13427 RepID=A0ACB9D1Q8_CICIN|nr:hypothetical protein L2E82_30672 [Cichorium intybus]
MQSFHVLHLLILISLITTLIEAQSYYYSKPRCRSGCGEVAISYPFGIGKDCSLNEWYTIDCNSLKPYLSALNNVEVLNLDASTQTVTVNMSVINADCKNPVKNSNLVLGDGHGKSPFKISGLNNALVVKGCGHGAIMKENGTIVTGCSTTCGKDTVSDTNNCFGVGCCQTTIPHDLESFTFNLTGLEMQDGDGTCGSAYLVDITFVERQYVQRLLGNVINEEQGFVPISLSWNEKFDVNSTTCNETCGEVSIPYPFGIERNCSTSDWFNVVCNSSIPYLSAFNNVEVLDFNMEKEIVTVNVPVISNCENSVQDNNLVLSKSPLRFSGLHNIFVAEGCGGVVIVENGTAVGGCSTTCGNDTVSDTNNCFGVGCCQTAIPRDLESFTVDLTSLGRQAGNGTCGSAFLVDTNYFMEGRFSPQFVPITLVWPYISVYDTTECRWCERRGGFCNQSSADDGTSVMSCIYFGSSKNSLGVILAVRRIYEFLKVVKF